MEIKHFGLLSNNLYYFEILNTETLKYAIIISTFEISNLILKFSIFKALI